MNFIKVILFLSQNYPLLINLENKERTMEIKKYITIYSEIIHIRNLNLFFTVQTNQ